MQDSPKSITWVFLFQTIAHLEHFRAKKLSTGRQQTDIFLTLMSASSVLFSKMKFSGLRSRWQIPFEWQ
jgi:ABC-type branched-subunit amino acid transport system ATPase component